MHWRAPACASSSKNRMEPADVRQDHDSRSRALLWPREERAESLPSSPWRVTLRASMAAPLIGSIGGRLSWVVHMPA